LLAVRRRARGVPLLVEEVDEGLSKLVVVLDDEDVVVGARHRVSFHLSNEGASTPSASRLCWNADLARRRPAVASEVWPPCAASGSRRTNIDEVTLGIDSISFVAKPGSSNR